jgi:fructokinase
VIVVVGEALVDLAVHPDGTVGAHLGGGPFNTARTLGRLDVPVAFLGRLSTDAFGRRLRDALAADGVSLDGIALCDEPTTLALAELDQHGAATYRFYVEGTSVPGLTTAHALAVLPPLEALHVGTLGLVLEPLADATTALVDRLAGDALVMVDPNVRPGVIGDEAAYRARLDRVLAQADVVKVSDDDLAWLAPGVAPEDAARRILDIGAGVVMVTLGARGALVVGAGFAEAVRGPDVTVADTIGAGDAFAGGVLAWWHDNGWPELTDAPSAVAATAFACRVAAATVARPGADPPRRADLAPST